MTEENAAPLLVVGMEGVWGVLIMVLVVFPWAQMLPGSDQGACLENLADSWIMVQNSETVRVQHTQMDGGLLHADAAVELRRSAMRLR